MVMCGYRFKGNKKIKKIKRKKNKKEKKSECVWVSECDNCYESKKGNEWLVLSFWLIELWFSVFYFLFYFIK